MFGVDCGVCGRGVGIPSAATATATAVAGNRSLSSSLFLLSFLSPNQTLFLLPLILYHFASYSRPPSSIVDSPHPLCRIGRRRLWGTAISYSCTKSIMDKLRPRSIGKTEISSQCLLFGSSLHSLWTLCKYAPPSSSHLE